MGLKEDKEQIKAINAEIEELSKRLRQAPSLFKENDIAQAKTYLNGLKQDLRETNSELSYIADSFKRSLQELSKQNVALNQGKNALKGISNISSQLLSIKYGEVDADSKSLEKLQQKAQLKFQELQQSIRLLETENARTGEFSKQLAELKGAAKEQSEFLRGQQQILDLQKKIEKNKGVRILGGLGDIAKAIPGLNKFTSAFQEASKAAKDTARQNELTKEYLDDLAKSEGFKGSRREFFKDLKERDKAAEKQRKADLEALKSGKELNQQQLERLYTKEQLKEASLSDERKADVEALKSGKGLTKETLKRLGIEKKFQDEKTLDALKSGKGLTKEKIKQLGLEDKLVSKTGKSLSGSHAATKARKQLLKGIKPAVPAKGAAIKSVAKLAPKAISSAFAKGAKILLKSATKFLGPIGLLIELIMALFQGDKATGELAKNLNISYKSALKVRQEFFRIATAAGDNYVLTEGIQKSNEAITKQLGIQQKIMNSGLLVSMTKLRERAGFTNDELLGAVNLQLSSKKTLDEITTEILGQTKLTSLQNNVNIDQKEVLRDISKISKATTLSLGKNPSALADAVTQARALGMTLSQIESISENLLNFESSLTNELKAELLLGRNINLERARLFAINNNIAGVAKEISSQIGNSADFAKMNVLQQKALAEAVGMNREELAKTLFVQENISATTDDEIIKQKFLLQQLADKYGIEEARRRVGEESLDTLMNQVSVTDDFNAMLNKLKEIFVGIAPTILYLAKELASLLESVGKFMAFFSGTPILDKPKGDDLSVNPKTSSFNQAVDSFPTANFMVNPQAALGGALAKGLIKAFNQPTNTNNPLENERNRAQQEQFRKQNQQMQELINATVENRPPVDMFGGLYGD